jgi:hypothetical protein
MQEITISCLFQSDLRRVGNTSIYAMNPRKVGMDAGFQNVWNEQSFNGAQDRTNTTNRLKIGDFIAEWISKHNYG